MNNNITLVTGLWDINRDSLQEGWSRSYNHYIQKFSELLESPYNMIIFGDDDIRDLVTSKRKEENTQFIHRKKTWFMNEFFEQIQKIRTSETWRNQAFWLGNSTQGSLELYNPLVMSKVFLLHDAKILDKFNSSHLYWIDAGLTNTVHKGYFTHDKVFKNLNNIDNIVFVSFPYKASNEIHGFDYEKLCEYANNNKVDKVCRGGFFGGSKDSLSEFNSLYYHLMKETLEEGYMGTEESLFTILLYKHPDFFKYYKIEDNGLLSTFFEDLKNNRHELLSESKKQTPEVKFDNIGLYIITFNSPKQVQTLLDSMELYDINFIQKPRMFLLDNSTDLSTTDDYLKICEKYNITHIKKDNIGITGGRQFIAEHAYKEELDGYWFFEDDMFFYNGKEKVCRNGFNRQVRNLYNTTLEIVKKEDFDFIKLNYTEFYGDNGIQWSWYNVPQKVREEYWPEKPNLPKIGFDTNPPKTKFEKIITHKGVPYASGEIYLCNWPQFMTKKGNYKCYIETKFASPYEQTIMSYVFQETKKGEIKPGILLLTPTEHDRFDHYDSKLRKEC